MELRADELIADRPFAAPDRTAEDGEVLRRMWTRLRIHVQGMGAADRSGHRLDRVADADGSVHTIVLPNLRRALTSDDLFGVGFFGQARQQVDHSPIIELEAALIADMPSTPGLVAYYNAFDPSAGWGNLVLFEDQGVERAWGGDPRHADAVRRSPAHYHSIRLHHARAVGGLLGSGAIQIIRTRYIDFGDDPPWRAIREFGV